MRFYADLQEKCCALRKTSETCICKLNVFRPGPRFQVLEERYQPKVRLPCNARPSGKRTVSSIRCPRQCDDISVKWAGVQLALLTILPPFPTNHQ